MTNNEEKRIDNHEIMDVIDLLEDKIAGCDLLAPNRQKYLLTLAQVKVQFKTTAVAPKFAEVYDSLVAKGGKLAGLIRVNAEPKELNGKIRYYINYLNAALGDFQGQTYRLTSFYRVFLLCSILFLALSPMFLTPIFPIIFIVPIVLAMKGIKQRSKGGFWLAMLIAPVSIMASVMWVRYGIHVLGNFSGAVASMMESAGVSQGVASALTGICPVLGCILLVLAGVLIYQGSKVKNLFI